MTDDVLAVFSRRFVDDVRRCAAGSAPAVVAEIEARVHVALVAPPPQRMRCWARVVAAVNELLAGLPSRNAGAAARLRAFVRENAHLGRPRDVAITDFRFVMRADRVLRDRSGRSYLVYASIPRASKRGTPRAATAVRGLTGRIAAWTASILRSAFHSPARLWRGAYE